MAASASAEMRFQEELNLMLRVPYPLLFVQSYEEQTVLQFLRTASRAFDQQLLAWSVVRGVYDPVVDSVVEQADLDEALVLLSSLQQPAVLVLLDPEPGLSSPGVVRRLREMLPMLAVRRQSIVVVSPNDAIPPDLARDAVVLRAPLPSRSTLFALLEGALPSERFPLLPREPIVAASRGLTCAESTRAFTRARIRAEESPSLVSFDWERCVLEEKKRAVGSDDVVEFVDEPDGLPSVGGMEDLKEWLETRKAAFTEEAREFGLPVPKGLLLVGIQGCGKSLLAKAVARHWGLPLLRLEIGAVFAGNRAPDAALHRALRIAESLSPSVLWTDEIEKGFPSDSGESTQRVLGTLLTWLQEKQSEVFFVATANEATKLPPELLRKGRFDELFFVDLPDRQARAHIFSIHLRKRGRSPGEFDLGALAASTEHFSGAEIEQMVIASLYEAFAEGREVVQDDLTQVISETIPLYATREDAIKSLREWARTRTRFAAKDSRLVDFFEDDLSL